MKKRDIFLSFLSGVLLTLSFPNFDLEFLAWFAFVPLLYAIDGKTRLHAFTLGFLTGFSSSSTLHHCCIQSGREPGFHRQGCQYRDHGFHRSERKDCETGGDFYGRGNERDHSPLEK
jgi:hypothetical protein